MAFVKTSSNFPIARSNASLWPTLYLIYHSLHLDFLHSASRHHSLLLLFCWFLFLSLTSKLWSALGLGPPISLFLDYLIQSRGFNTSCMLVAPRFIFLAQISALNFKLMYPNTYWTSSIDRQLQFISQN